MPDPVNQPGNTAAEDVAVAEKPVEAPIPQSATVASATDADIDDALAQNGAAEPDFFDVVSNLDYDGIVVTGSDGVALNPDDPDITNSAPKVTEDQLKVLDH